VGVVAAGLLFGCGRAPAPPSGTGAREAAVGYLHALSKKDWPGAYAALHRESRGRYSLEQFGRLARNYRDHLGFEPSAVRVRACEEQGDRAIAHMVWTGRGQYKDAVELRREGEGWGVVLPKNFGQVRK
jgi:hypothetical protein